MKMAILGALSIEVTPTSENPEILHVDIGCERRKDTVSMVTNKDETIDQFTTRIRSMLRALINGEPRDNGEHVVTPEPKKKDKTWPEQKEEMKRALSDIGSYPK